jgi:YhcH/YjgK/YiaL family protein
MFMIVDKVGNLRRYAALFPKADILADFFEKAPGLTEGAEVRLEGFTFTPFAFKTGPSKEKRWEIHREHIDIHVAVAGRECIEWIPVRKLNSPAEYVAETDVELFADTIAGTELILEEGYFALLEPGDAHKPSVAAKGLAGGVKAVIKADVFR